MGIRDSRRCFRRCHITFSFLNISLITIFFCIYLTNHFLIKPNLDWVISDGYLNDALGMAILLAYSNLVIISCDNRRLLILSFSRIFTFAFLVGLFWEYITPLYRSNSVSDPFDLLAYLSGASVYYSFLRSKLFF